MFILEEVTELETASEVVSGKDMKVEKSKVTVDEQIVSLVLWLHLMLTVLYSHILTVSWFDKLTNNILTLNLRRLTVLLANLRCETSFLTFCDLYNIPH